MKKTITVIALLAGAVTGYSQGQIYFYMYGTEGSPASTLHQVIYGAQAGSYTVTYGTGVVTETLGSVSTTAKSTESPAGSQTYNSSLLGGSAATGTAYDAELLAASGASAVTGGVDTLLTPVTGTLENFYTTAGGAGYVKGVVTPSLTTLGYGAAGSTVTIAVAAWAINSGGDQGAATSLALAVADAAMDAGEVNDGGYAWGISDTANDVISTSTVPTGMPSTIETFSLGAPVAAIPEPSTIALGVIGASTLLFRRRK